MRNVTHCKLTSNVSSLCLCECVRYCCCCSLCCLGCLCYFMCCVLYMLPLLLLQTDYSQTVTLCATNCGTSDVSLWVIMCGSDLELDTLLLETWSWSCSWSCLGTEAGTGSALGLALALGWGRYVSSSSSHVQLLALVLIKSNARRLAQLPPPCLPSTPWLPPALPQLGIFFIFASFSSSRGVAHPSALEALLFSAAILLFSYTLRVSRLFI